MHILYFHQSEEVRKLDMEVKDQYILYKNMLFELSEKFSYVLFSLFC